MRHEIGQHVANVERKIAPDVSLRRRDLIFVSKAEFEESLHPGATAFQCGNKLPRRNAVVIDARRRDNAVLATERLKPAAPGVVEVRGDSADRPLRYAGNRDVPECWWQGLDELHRDAVIGPPSSEQARP